MSWSPDGQRIAIGSKKDVLSVVDVRKFKIVHERQFDDQLNKIEFHPSGAYAVASTGKGEVAFLDPASLVAKHTLSAHVAPCYSLDFSACGRYLVSSGGEGLIGLWDLTEMACVKTFPCRESFARFVSLNHDSSLIACLCEDDVIDVVRGIFVVCVSPISHPHGSAYFLLDFLSCTVCLSLTCTFDRSFQHDVESGELVLTMPPMKETGYAVAWNPKHNALAWVGDERNGANVPVLSLLTPPNK